MLETISCTQVEGTCWPSRAVARHSLCAVMDAVPSCVPIQVTVYIPQNKNTEASGLLESFISWLLGGGDIGNKGTCDIKSSGHSHSCFNGPRSSVVCSVVCQPVRHSVMSSALPLLQNSRSHLSLLLFFVPIFGGCGG